MKHKKPYHIELSIGIEREIGSWWVIGPNDREVCLCYTKSAAQRISTLLNKDYAERHANKETTNE